MKKKAIHYLITFASALIVTMIVCWSIQYISVIVLKNSAMPDILAKRLEASKSFSLNPFVNMAAWAHHLFTLKGGYSHALAPGVEMSGMIGTAFYMSMKLFFFAAGFGILFGVLIGLLNSLHNSRILHWISQGMFLLFFGVPSFVFCIYLMDLFGIQIPILPVIYTSGKPFYSFVIPGTSLALMICAITARLIRICRFAGLESLNDPTLSFFKRLRPSLSALWHLLVRWIKPFMLLYMINAILIEKIASLPGLGSLLLQSLNAFDGQILSDLLMMLAGFWIVLSTVCEIFSGFESSVRLDKEGMLQLFMPLSFTLHKLPKKVRRPKGALIFGFVLLAILFYCSVAFTVTSQPYAANGSETFAFLGPRIASLSWIPFFSGKRGMNAYIGAARDSYYAFGTGPQSENMWHTVWSGSINTLLILGIGVVILVLAAWLFRMFLIKKERVFVLFFQRILSMQSILFFVFVLSLIPVLNYTGPIAASVFGLLPLVMMRMKRKTLFSEHWSGLSKIKKAWYFIRRLFLVSAQYIWLFLMVLVLLAFVTNGDHWPFSTLGSLIRQGQNLFLIMPYFSLIPTFLIGLVYLGCFLCMYGSFQRMEYNRKAQKEIISVLEESVPSSSLDEQMIQEEEKDVYE